MQNIKDYLLSKTYPGRGIICGCDESLANIFLAYFIMGRSQNSRNRVFEKTGLDIKTRAFDESKMEDPSLIIYTPVRHLKNNRVIITNGDQTDTIYNYLQSNKSFKDALDTRTYEPDEPNFTPRISLLLDYNDSQSLSYQMSVIKALPDKTADRQYYNFKLQSGTARMIHTYFDDGNPIPPFNSSPIELKVGNDFDRFSQDIWDGLNNENKISLFCEKINIQTKAIKSSIINKNMS